MGAHFKIVKSSRSKNVSFKYKIRLSIVKKQLCKTTANGRIVANIFFYCNIYIHTMLRHTKNTRIILWLNKIMFRWCGVGTITLSEAM
jgi:hypothetical protein